MTRVLVVEDDAKLRATLVFQLREQGYEAEGVGSAESALVSIEAVVPDLLLLDVRLPMMSGVELVHQLVGEKRLPPTVVVSGEASISETVEALRLGVHEFLEKPFSKERLLRSVENTLEHERLRQRVLTLESRIEEDKKILGDCEPMKVLRESISRVAATDARVLIRGESGTGKELVADAIHRQGARRDGPFIKVNCAALPAQLIEDELFGHARGAFTDAREDKAGLFELADEGTLFLDEIGDMEVALQSRLLRVLEDGRVRRLGSAEERVVDVRVLSATHEDLDAAVESGAFREDLFFRLAHVPLDVPPLRDRLEDLPLLFEHFLATHCKRHRRPPLSFDPATLEPLSRYDWPGNVRELSSLCERLVVFAVDPVTADQLPESYRNPDRRSLPAELLSLDPEAAVLPLRELRDQVESEYIREVLRRASGNMSEAARLLGLQRSYLYEKMARLGLRRR